MKNSSVYVIAEAGSNHDSSLDQAKKLIEVAAEAGADAVKFQLFRADILCDRNSPAYSVVKANELPRDWVPTLLKHCQALKIDFLATPFDKEAVDLLDSAGLKMFKWASSETTNQKLLFQVARTKKPVILSTGMCTLADIADALDILDANGCPQVTLLHCYSVYPTEYQDANLRVMQTLQNAFQREVGLSDHSLDISLPIAAVAMGARVIEKHFTLSRQLKGPDHSYALEPSELKAMIRHIRNVETALGRPEKKLHRDEIEWCRLNGLYAGRDLKKGESVGDGSLKKRPLRGVPARFQSLVQDLKTTGLAKGSPIRWEDLSE